MRRSTLTIAKSGTTKPNRRAPADIPKELRPLYLSICSHLEEGGRFNRETDERLVRQYVHALHEAEQARAQVEADGLVVAAAQGGIKAHPLIAIANQARLTSV